MRDIWERGDLGRGSLAQEPPRRPAPRPCTAPRSTSRARSRASTRRAGPCQARPSGTTRKSSGPTATLLDRPGSRSSQLGVDGHRQNHRTLLRHTGLLAMAPRVIGSKNTHELGRAEALHRKRMKDVLKDMPDSHVDHPLPVTPRWRVISKPSWASRWANKPDVDAMDDDELSWRFNRWTVRRLRAAQGRRRRYDG